MQFKIDTKEKFTVITPNQEILSDNLTAALFESINSSNGYGVKNIVLNLKNVLSVEESAAASLVQMQQGFYENSASFVICEVTEAVEKKLEELELLEFMNVTPSETEAWDIVQMEEIERELMDDDNPLFNDHQDDTE